MRGAVRQFGGIVSKELGDGIAAVFGAPIADDNHAPLACHAALELVRRVGSLGDSDLQVRVGLHSGHVVAYMVASEFSKVYEIGGAAQHLAARLESAAEANQIYVSEACQKLADGHVRFEFWAAGPCVASTSPCRSIESSAPAIFRVGGCGARAAFHGSSIVSQSARCSAAPQEVWVSAVRRFCCWVMRASASRGWRTSSPRTQGRWLAAGRCRMQPEPPWRSVQYAEAPLALVA